MTYRATRGGRAARRAAHKQKMRDAEVRATVHARVKDWYAKNPPHIRPPVERLPVGWEREMVLHNRVRHDFSCTPKPEHPIVRVPIIPSLDVLRSMRIGDSFGPCGPSMSFIEMRPIAMGLDAGGTYLRWWNWEPTRWGDDYKAEAELRQTAGKVAHFADQCSKLFKELMSVYRTQALYSWQAMQYAPNLMWFDELRDAVEEWMGLTRTRYLLPPETPGAPAKVVER